MFTVYGNGIDERDCLDIWEVLDYLRTLDPDMFVCVDAPAGRYTGVDTIPYSGHVNDVIADLRWRYDR